MSLLGAAAGIVAPYYNMGLAIVVIILFIKLFKEQKGKKARHMQWKLLFAALMIFLVQQSLTILKQMGTIYYPQFINQFFELGMITFFIYMVLAQKQYVKKFLDKSKNE